VSGHGGARHPLRVVEPPGTAAWASRTRPLVERVALGRGEQTLLAPACAFVAAHPLCSRVDIAAGCGVPGSGVVVKRAVLELVKAGLLQARRTSTGALVYSVAG
jgi:hypothetical protein